MFILSRSWRSTSKHSGALMSSRLMPPKVGSSEEITCTISSIFGASISMSKDVDAGEFLEQNGFAFHHRLGGERADIAEPEHGVPLEITATRLAREV